MTHGEQFRVLAFIASVWLLMWASWWVWARVSRWLRARAWLETRRRES